MFIKKKVFTKLDVLQEFENMRYESFYTSYQYIDYWPWFDNIASYGHFFNNLLIVYIAIKMNTNFYMVFNVICVCLYYSIATVRLSKRAFNCYNESGL
jgi:hypothetical protein